MAFEIPAVDEDKSIIKKHPPKRLQKLEDMQVDAGNVSEEALAEKQAEAERRRQQVRSSDLCIVHYTLLV